MCGCVLKLSLAATPRRATISRHLAVLRAGSLVVSERKGQAIYYELNTSVFQDLVQHLVGWVKPLGQAAPGERPLLKARRTQQA